MLFLPFQVMHVLFQFCFFFSVFTLWLIFYNYMCSPVTEYYLQVFLFLCCSRPLSWWMKFLLLVPMAELWIVYVVQTTTLTMPPKLISLANVPGSLLIVINKICPKSNSWILFISSEERVVCMPVDLMVLPGSESPLYGLVLWGSGNFNRKYWKAR